MERHNLGGGLFQLMNIYLEEMVLSSTVAALLTPRLLILRALQKINHVNKPLNMKAIQKGS